MSGPTSAIEAIGWLPPGTPTTPTRELTTTPLAPTDLGTGAVDFSTWFTHGLASVNAKVNASERNLQALAAGETENLHQVMLSLEEARLSFQLMAQVRTRLLETYQDLMRMQL